MGIKTWYANQQARHDAYQAEQAAKKIDARVPKPVKRETMTIQLDIARPKHAKKLAALTADGWEILSEHRRSAWVHKGGQADYVLTRTTGGYYN